MKIDQSDVYGFEHAIRAMRNPKDSWDKSDSFKAVYLFEIKLHLGKSDIILSQKLTKAGSEHCKHLRMIQVWADLTLPRYIWQELDTYKHIEKVSCSTMHTLMCGAVSKDDFEGSFYEDNTEYVNNINKLLQLYDTTQDASKRKAIKLKVKQMLPESFLQTRTINTNYQQLLNIYKQRKSHELPEWKEICNWIISLPYFTELTGISE